MKYFLFWILGLLAISTAGFSQQNRFVYLQTDNKQPFYVKLGTVVYSSSASGYLIIPKLTDKAYDLLVGFPKNEFPEQQISLQVAGKDAGYVLKNFGEKGWGLFNLQTMAVVMASGQTVAKGADKPVAKNDNEFSRVLADVVNSPDIAQAKTQAPVVVEKEKTAVTNKTPESEKPEPVKLPSASAIRKLQDNISDTGRQMIYIDQGDTILVYFPSSRVESKTSAGKKEGDNKKEEKEEEKRQAGIPEEVHEAPLKVEKKPVPANAVQSPLPANCLKLASDDDFLKVRKKMASRTNDFDMISDAMKSFKARCYTTEQIRNLSVLFLTNQGKYSFFDASYNYVSDPQLFISLREVLTDDYFRSRFDAMIRK